MRLLVDCYRKMRERDAANVFAGTGTGGAANVFAYGRSAWRVTIRQLESLIRLSEALAKLYCQDLVRSLSTIRAYSLNAA